MKKILLCSATYTEDHPMYHIFRQQTMPRFEKYCKYHGWELVILYENQAPMPEMLGWSRLFWIKDNKELQNGDIVAGIGADCCLINCKEEMNFDCDFSVPMESTGVLCMDFFTVRISDWSRLFLEEMCSLERREKTKGAGEEIWAENGMVYQVLGLNWGCGEAQIGERQSTPFTKEELLQHIKILPIKWNVTYDPDDVDWTINKFGLGDQRDPDWIYKIISQYYRPDRYCTIKDIAIRHLSAGTVMLPWAQRYFNESLIFE